MRADRIVVCLHLDAPSGTREMVPIAQHRAQRRQQPVGNVAGALALMRAVFGDAAAERRDTRAQHVHGMTGGRQLLKHGR